MHAVHLMSDATCMSLQDAFHHIHFRARMTMQKKKNLALALFVTYHDSMLWKLESRFQEIAQSQFHAQDLLSRVAAFVSKSEE